MLRERSEEQYGSDAEGGVRRLFALGQYEFQDTMDGEERFHHFILEQPSGDEPRPAYEVDRDTMYEFMARYLAGAHEMEEYSLERSPTHESLLDVLEIVTARARGGEAEFTWEEFDQVETEVLDDDDAPDDEPDDEADDEA